MRNIRVRPSPVRCLENWRIEDQAADEDEEKDNSSAECAEKHFCEPVKQSQVTDQSRYRETPPRPEHEASIASGFKEDSIEVIVGCLDGVKVGRIATKPISPLFMKFLHNFVDILFHDVSDKHARRRGRKTNGGCI